MEKNQKINCEVESCKFQNQTDKLCTLDEIVIDNNTSNEIESKKSTLCNSFEFDNSNL